MAPVCSDSIWLFDNAEVCPPVHGDLAGIVSELRRVVGDTFPEVTLRFDCFASQVRQTQLISKPRTFENVAGYAGEHGRRLGVGWVGAPELRCEQPMPLFCFRPILVDPSRCGANIIVATEF